MYRNHYVLGRNGVSICLAVTGIELFSSSGCMKCLMETVNFFLLQMSVLCHFDEMAFPLEEKESILKEI